MPTVCFHYCVSRAAYLAIERIALCICVATGAGLSTTRLLCADSENSLPEGSRRCSEDSGSSENVSGKDGHAEGSSRKRSKSRGDHTNATQRRQSTHRCSKRAGRAARSKNSASEEFSDVSQSRSRSDEEDEGFGSADEDQQGGDEGSEFSGSAASRKCRDKEIEQTGEQRGRAGKGSGAASAFVLCIASRQLSPRPTLETAHTKVSFLETS